MNIEKISVNRHYVWVDKDMKIEHSVGERNGFQYDYQSDGYYYKSYKIIAASPELNLEGVPTYVRWLARKEFPKDGTQESGYLAGGYVIGYQAAEKEKSDEVLTKFQEGIAKGLELCKKLYTEDDVRRAIELARDIDYNDTNDYSYTEEEIIEQLKSQKTK